MNRLNQPDFGWDYPPGVSSLPGDHDQDIAWSLCVVEDLAHYEPMVTEDGSLPPLNKTAIINNFVKWLDIKKNGDLYLDHICLTKEDDEAGGIAGRIEFCISGITTVEVSNEDLDEGYTEDIINAIIDDLNRASPGTLNWSDYRGDISIE